MRRATTTRAVLLLVAPVIALWLHGCDSTEAPTSPTESTPVRITVFAVGTPISTLVVEVTAADIKNRLVHNVEVVDGVASGTIGVPAGEARTFAVTAFDDQHNVTHEGSATTDVSPGSNPPLKVKLKPVAGEIEVTVTFGDYTVLVTPSSATIDAAVSTELQLEVSVFDQYGELVAGPQVQWATTNPSLASVTASGLVTGLADGAVTIAATFDGVVGLSELTLTGFDSTPPPPENQPPWIIGVEIQPMSPADTDPLLCTVQDYGDADGDDVTLSYAWYVNGVVTFESTSTLGSEYSSGGDMVFCEATADDTKDTSTERSQTVTIAPGTNSCTVTAECPPGYTCNELNLCVPDDPSNPIDFLIITEVLSDPGSSSTYGEFVEFYNPTSSEINLVGSIVLTVNGSTETILAGIVGPGEYCVVGDSTHNAACTFYVVEGLSLPNNGALVQLEEGSTIGSAFEYTYSVPGSSWIRDSNGTICNSEPTPGAPNICQ